LSSNEFQNPKRILSSAIYNGGFYISDTVVNVHTSAEQMLNQSPESVISCFLEKYKKDKGAVGLLTSAEIKYAQFVYIHESDLKVFAIVTAGTSNALNITERTDTNFSGKPFMFQGTINIILVSCAQLLDDCMVSAVITATEAKTAALLDLKVRSVYSGIQATGTGTDAVVIVSGQGQKLRYAGGHTLFGQIIGDAVYKGVKQSLSRQLSNHPGNDILKSFDP